MKVQRIDHLNLTVADLAHSVEFYQRVLGMEVENLGERRVALHFGQQKIQLEAAGAASPAMTQKRMPAHICFITQEPVSAVLSHLEQHGVPVRMGPGPRAGAIGTIQSIYIDDPDQNSIEISSY